MDVSYPSLHNKLPWNLAFNYNCLLSHCSWRQESGSGFPGWFCPVAERHQLVLSPLESLTLMKDLCPDSLPGPLAGDCFSSPCGHLWRAALGKQMSSFPQSQRQGQRWKLQGFYNLISEGTYHLFCHNLLLHKPSPVHYGRGYDRVWILGGRHHWGHLGGWLPQTRVRFMPYCVEYKSRCT